MGLLMYIDFLEVIRNDATNNLKYIDERISIERICILIVKRAFHFN